MARIALIVGAGIGGLSAGIALQKAGWNVRIFERASSPRELGFGVSLAPNAVAALRELGVADVVLARSFAPATMSGEVRRMDGTVLKRGAFPVVAALGGQLAIALRPALHGALLEAVGLERVAVSREATGFSLRDGRVTLHLTDGDVDGDLLVGADGVYSTIRRVLHPTEQAPRPSNVVAIRGAVQGAHQHLGHHSGILYFGRGVESVLMRASETGIYWYLSMARELLPPDLREPKAILALMAPRFDDTFRAVTSATEDLRVDELFDRDPLPFWGEGVVTLLGDAAHPLLPHTGQGAAQAIVDAVTLGKRLSDGSGIERALKAYEAERRPKTAVLVGQGRRTARIMRTMNPVACYMRELVLRMIPMTPVVKFFATINRRAGTDVRH